MYVLENPSFKMLSLKTKLQNHRASKVVLRGSGSFLYIE